MLLLMNKDILKEILYLGVKIGIHAHMKQVIMGGRIPMHNINKDDMWDMNKDIVKKKIKEIDKNAWKNLR